jgi:hypothetical protein
VFRVITFLLIAILIAGLGMFALAGVANAAAPGDMLYGVDRAVEQVNLALVRSPERAVEVRVAIAAERLGEVQSLLARGKTEQAERALAEFERSLVDAAPAITSAEGMVAYQASESMDAAFEPEYEAFEDSEDMSLYCEGGAYMVDAPEHPVGRSLANTYGVELAEIMGWYCQGYGMGEIKLAYATAARVPDYTPDELFAMRAERLGWGEIWNAVGLIAHPGKDAKGGANVPSDGDDEQDDRNGVCANDRIHPHGQQLANQVGAEYEVIMDWFCQGYGFGEIKLAYAISQKAQVDVETVFELRASGMGWGQVMAAYDLNGSDLKDKDKGKPDNTPGGPPADKPVGPPDKKPKP